LSSINPYAHSPVRKATLFPTSGFGLKVLQMRKDIRKKFSASAS